MLVIHVAWNAKSCRGQNEKGKDDQPLQPFVLRFSFRKIAEAGYYPEIQKGEQDEESVDCIDHLKLYDLQVEGVRFFQFVGWQAVLNDLFWCCARYGLQARLRHGLCVNDQRAYS